MALDHGIDVVDDGPALLLHDMEDQHRIDSSRAVEAGAIVKQRRHLAVAMADRLVEQALVVTHAAFARPHDHRKRLRLEADALALEQLLQMCRHHVGRHAPEVEPHAAAEDRHRHLADFGGGEDELHMRGRFFQRLQQRVEGGGRQHVHFVDDIDFEPRRGGTIVNGINDFADVAHAGAAGRVHLHHVDMAAFGYGAAGYGYTMLRRWMKTGQQADLDAAKTVAAALLLQGREADGGLYWEDKEQQAGVGVGLWEGGSGIALFFLYLYCATQHAEYLEAGKKALQADLAFGKETNGSYGFPRRSNVSILYPYLGHGTAGVASVVLRYYAVTADPAYLAFIHAVKQSVSVKYTINSGLFDGISGLGNYLLDAYDFLQDPTYHQLACQAASALNLFAIKRDEGLCFPASNRAKLNVDYADGSAGIGLFLHRLAHEGENFNFMSDQLIWDHIAQHGPSQLAQRQHPADMSLH